MTNDRTPPISTPRKPPPSPPKYILPTNHSPISPLTTLPQALPHTPADPPLKLPPILPPQSRRLDIRRALIVRTRQHANHAEQNRLGRLHRRPALRGRFVAVFVVFGRVQDRDADFAGGVDCAGGLGVRKWGERGCEGEEREGKGREGKGETDCSGER